MYLDAPGELPPDPAGEELHQLLLVHVQQLVQVHATEHKLPEQLIFILFEHFPPSFNLIQNKKFTTPPSDEIII